VCLIFGLALPAGCIFSPHRDDTCKNCGGPPPVYPPLINPFLVLSALETAYQHKDSTEIKLIYDENYEGSSFDPQNANSTISLRKLDEVRHVEALYRTTTISNVTLQFPASMFRETDLNDPPGWTMIKVQGLLFEIDDAGTTYNLLANNIQEFKFIPTAPDSTSPTDTTWKIVRWTELP